MEIAATPEAIVLTSGATQGLDLVVRLLVKPGDTVIVGNQAWPAWPAQLGALAMHGANLVSVSYRADRPDLDS